MTKQLQNPSKIVKNPAGGPPKAGLIWSPDRKRWVKPRSGAPGLYSPINPALLRSMTLPEIDKLRSDIRAKVSAETDQYRFNDLTRVMRQIVEESKRRQVDKILRKAQNLSKRMAAQDVLAGTELLLKGLSLEDAIPLAQIRGELGRAGHVVKSIIALDPESRRIFFMDGANNPKYCSFAGPDGGFAVTKIGYQADIAKEYDPADLEVEGDEAEAFTTHEERDYEDTPGMIPAGSPGEKAELKEQDFEDAGQFGDGVGDAGFGGTKDTLKSIMGRIQANLNKQG